MKERIKELAEQAGLFWQFSLAYEKCLYDFAELVRQDEREAILCLYSFDGTAADWADKIVARGNHGQD